MNMNRGQGGPTDDIHDANVLLLSTPNWCASHSCHGYRYTSLLPLICVVSHQEWSMSLQKTGKSAYTCKIERYVDLLKSHFMVVTRYVLMPHFLQARAGILPLFHEFCPLCSRVSS